MRVILSLAAVAALFLSSMTSALASGISKSEVSKILTEQGYAVRDFDSTKIVVTVGEYSIIIGIAGADSDISYITFVPGISSGDIGYDFLNNFNNEVKFGRAYIDSDGDVAIQMDRNSAGGVSAENIESDFDVFLLLIAKFLSDLESQTIA